MTDALLTGSFGGGEEEVRPAKGDPTHLFVAYPIQEQVVLPALNGAEPQYGYRAGPFSHHHFADLRPLRFEHTESPLYFEIGELDADGVEPQRDGSVALHLPTVPAVVVVERHLAALVRVFSTAQAALVYAQAQNALLATLHDQWRSGANKLCTEAQAMIGRATANSTGAVPFRPAPRWVAPDNTAGVSHFDDATYANEARLIFQRMCDMFASDGARPLTEGEMRRIAWFASCAREA